MTDWVDVGPIPEAQFKIEEAGRAAGHLLTKFSDQDESQWNDLGNVIGPPGEPGPQGEQGEQGEPGHVVLSTGYYRIWFEQTAPGEVTPYRQWYCSTDPLMQDYQPIGEPVAMPPIALPPGPAGEQGTPGDYFNITSTNPAPHVANFYKQRLRFDGTPATTPPDPQMFGGIEAPPGPTGDYYRITAEVEGNTITFYRQRFNADNSPAGGQEVLAGPIEIAGIPGPTVPVGGLTIPPFANPTAWARLWNIAVQQARIVLYWHLQGSYPSATDEFASRTTSGLCIPGWSVEISNWYHGNLIFEQNLDAILATTSSEELQREARSLLHCATRAHPEYLSGDWSGVVADLGDPFTAVTTNEPAAALASLTAKLFAEATEDRRMACYDRIYQISEVTGTPAAINPCAPPPEPGTWSRTYNFLTGTHGWQANVGAGGVTYGEHIFGEGWKGSDYPASGGLSAWIKFTLPAGADLNTVQVEFSDVAFTEYQYRGLWLYGSHGQDPILAEGLAPGAFITLSNPNVPSGILQLSILANAVLAPTRIKRVILTGEGTAPPPV